MPFSAASIDEVELHLHGAHARVGHIAISVEQRVTSRPPEQNEHLVNGGWMNIENDVVCK